MSADWEPLEIIDDSDEELDDINKNIVNQEKIATLFIRKKKNIKPSPKILKSCFYDTPEIFEIGVDEAGRGPMFGRVYAAAVVLPKHESSFDHSIPKDSKKFTSKQKIEDAYDYIKKNALAWYVAFEDEKTIDQINILQATQSAMHKAITEVRKQLIQKGLLIETDVKDNLFLLIDGNYFKPLTYVDKQTHKFETHKFQTVEGGDNKYTSIAAASILAKVERDKYIDEMCIQYPELSEKYGIDSNKGYGSKVHMEGIQKYGITPWHRRSFGICKNYA
jgi:ribonuclease HII